MLLPIRILKDLSSYKGLRIILLCLALMMSKQNIRQNKPKLRLGQSQNFKSKAFLIPIYSLTIATHYSLQAFSGLKAEEFIITNNSITPARKYNKQPQIRTLWIKNFLAESCHFDPAGSYMWVKNNSFTKKSYSHMLFRVTNLFSWMIDKFFTWPKT